MILQSHQSRCPVLNIRTEKLVYRVDPIGIGRLMDYEFQLEVGDLHETESTSKVFLGGEKIKNSDTHNDFYGFGTSPSDLIEWAERHKKKFGDVASVVVETTVTVSPIAFDGREPAFYRGAIQYFSVPTVWKRAAYRDPLPRTSEVLTVWKDGEFTTDKQLLDEMAARLKAADEAGDRRKA